MKNMYWRLFLQRTIIVGLGTITAGQTADFSKIFGTLIIDEEKSCDVFEALELKESGRIINMGKLDFHADVKIENGEHSSENENESTGALHNHGTIIIYNGAQIVSQTSGTSTGKIINYVGFTADENNSAKATRSMSSSGYKDDEYTYANLDTPDKLAHATYYDLVNGNQKVSTFVGVDGGKIVGTSATNLEDITDQNSISVTRRYPEVRDDIFGNDFLEDMDKYTYIPDGINVEPFETSGINQIDTRAGEAYNIGSALNYMDKYTSTHSSENKDEVQGSFYTLEGYTQYDAPVMTPNIEEKVLEYRVVDKKPSTKFKFNLSAEEEDGQTIYSYIPVAIPGVDDDIVMEKTVPEGEKLSDYELELKQDLAEGGFKFSQWSPNDPVTIYSGDNSWYNGKFKLKRGAVIIPSDAGIFGGNVELGEVEYTRSAEDLHSTLNNDQKRNYEEIMASVEACPPTEFEWQGGAKDEYNRPNIYMNGNSTLYFNLQDSAFSFYGNLMGTEKDRVIFEKGTVYIKGDCSNFKGKLAVVQGANFQVRSSDATSSSTYQGRFPKADVYQIDEEGNLAGADGEATFIDTEGLENVILNNGHIVLSSGISTVSLKSSTIAENSMTTIEGSSRIEDVTINGIAVATGDMEARNVKIDGGVFALQGGSLKTENLEVGSTIAIWGNDKIESVSVDNVENASSSFHIIDNHTLKFYADFNPETGTADQVNTSAKTEINSGNGIQIGGMNFLSFPTANEYRFTVLTGAASSEIPVMIGASYNNNEPTFVAYQNSNFVTKSSKTTEVNSERVYEYTSKKNPLLTSISPSGVGKITMNDGSVYYVYNSETAGNGSILMVKDSATPTEEIHMAGIGVNSILFELFSTGYAYKDKQELGKYSFWNNSHGECGKYDTSASSTIKTTSYGTIFGFDAKPFQVPNHNMIFIPTIFGGINHNDMKLGSLKANQKGYILGGKCALFGKKTSIELIAAYQGIKTHSKAGLEDTTNVKSHVFSLGTNFGYNTHLPREFILTPNILLDYSFVKTPKFTSNYAKKASVENMHIFSLVPGITLSKEFGRWKTSFSAMYHRIFKGKSKIKVNGYEFSQPEMVKNQYFECAAEVNMKAKNDKINLGLKLSKKIGKIRGIRGSLNFGIKF
ncbi:MAG: autotransporter outer membrane beta-barrel domain-containing protein [Holosporales bacterium]|jgi:hypothetical protein|nr:autotransporter outer membrane beta-barrel domain-containing protein [Holosporales bacterium]